MIQLFNFKNQKLQAAFLSLVVSVLLFTIKGYAYYLTSSQAILSDAFETIVNITAAAITLAVVIISSRPANRLYPYGHGKFELLASGFEGGAILLAGVFIISESTQALLSGAEPKQLNIGMALVALAGAVNGGLGWFLVKQGRKHNSKAIEASGQHVLSDFWTSLGVLVGLGLVLLTGKPWLDPLVAIVIALQLAYTGFKILIRSGADLLDAEDLTTIKSLAKLFEKHKFPGIIRIHHTRVIRSGSFHHVDCHLVVPGFWTIREAHDKSTLFENLVISDYKFDGEFHFHLDPCLRAYCTVCSVEQCPIRKEPFVENKPFTLEELLSPEEKPVRL